MPGIFILSILFGGLLNILGVSTPIVEHGVLASIVVCGALLAWGSHLSLVLTLGVVALFAFFHGEAMIANDGFVRNLPLFIAGCLFSALVLLGAGIGLGLMLKRASRLPVYRFAGFSMLAGAMVIAAFPSVNDCVIRLMEK